MTARTAVSSGLGEAEVCECGWSFELVPGTRIRHTDKGGDPKTPGVMETTVSLEEVFRGTELTVVPQGIPTRFPREACYLGGQESLELLAKVVEAESTEG